MLGLSDIVIFPGMVAPLLVETAESTKLIDDVVGGDRLLGVVLQRNAEAENPRPLEGKRSEKVADLIQKEISQMLVKSITDPRIGFVTITRVTVSEDCRFAKIYFSVAGSLEERENSTKGLDSAKGYIRKELGRRIRLRYTPEMMFQFDPSIEYAIHMEELIQSLHEQKEPKEDEEGN